MNASARGVCINVGCGSSPTPGWLNFDNSPTVMLANVPFVQKILARMGFLTCDQFEFITIARTQQVRRARATNLPLGSGVARAVYSSHMLEHLTRHDARTFVREAFRVLMPGGVLRLVVPDVQRIVSDYWEDRNADRMIERTLLAVEETGVRQRLLFALIGPRNHRWMYDGKSLKALIAEGGFESVSEMQPGVSRIAEPGALDLMERSAESVCVEGVRPR